jgi:hypothetical protein
VGKAHIDPEQEEPMRTLRYPLIAALACAALLAGAQAALAKTTKVPTSGGNARFSVDAVGGVSDTLVAATIRACDTARDGEGIVAFVYDNVDDSPLLGWAESRDGKGTCGIAEDVATEDAGEGAVTEFRVWVCRHDLSEDGMFDMDNVATERPDDPVLNACKKRVFD